MRKSFRCKAFFSGIIVLVTVTTAHADDRADKTYLDLVDQAEHAPESVDFTILRRAYASSRYYKR